MPQAQSATSVLDFAGLLGCLGFTDDERVSICHQRHGGRFGGKVYPDWRKALAEGQRLAQSPQQNVWVGANSLGPVGAGRGTEVDVNRLTAVVADLDFKLTGCRDLTTAMTIVDEVSDAFGGQPVAFNHSGHGLQVFWAVERSSALALGYPDEAKRLLTRCLALVAKIAAKHGCSIDSTFDLARVWRVPGSTNTKDPTNPVPVRCWAGSGTPLTAGALTAACDAAGISDAPVREKRSSGPRKVRGSRKVRGPLLAVTAARTRGNPSWRVRQELAAALADIASGCDRHPKTRDHVLALLGYGSRGQSGVAAALEALRGAFIPAVAGDRDGGEQEAAREFENFITGAEDLLDAPKHGTPRYTPRFRPSYRPSYTPRSRRA